MEVNSEKLKAKKKARNKGRHGYKKTKVGWIPQEWECVAIKEVCSQPVSGYSAKGTAEAVYPNDSNIGVLKLSCIMEGYFNSNENKKVVQADIPKIKASISKDTMLISRSNTEELVGIVCYVERDYPNLFLSDLIWQVSAKNAEILSIRWLTNLLLTKEYRRKIAARANGTSGSMKKITKRGFLTLLISLPPLPEQKKIAEILSAWDRAIEITNRLITNYELLKKGLMQQLLTGRMRFPEFDHEIHEKHEKKKGELPEGWKEVRLGRICWIRKGVQLNKSTLSTNGQYPVINGGVEPSGFTDKWNQKENTITISEGGNSCGYINYITQKFWSGGHCYTLEEVSQDKLYLYYFLKFCEYKIMRLRVGSGLPNIQKKDIHNYIITIPSLPEQTRIAAVLSTCDREIELLKKRQEKLKEQKKGLMQKLLTGEVRHPDFLDYSDIPEDSINDNQ